MSGKKIRFSILSVIVCVFVQTPLVLVDSVTEEGNAARIVLETGAEIDVEEAATLCVRVGWARRPPSKLKAALENSYLVASIHMEEFDGAPSAEHELSVRSRKLIGLARATSDHVFNATIWDVLIDPMFQKMGLGKALVEQSVRTLLRRGISNISLFADGHGTYTVHQFFLLCDAQLYFVFWKKKIISF